MWRSAGIVISVICVAAACGSSAPTSNPATAPVTNGGSSGAPAVGYATPPPKPWYRRGAHTVAFQSPTGNIICGLSADQPARLFCKTKNNGNVVMLNPTGPIHTNWTVGFGGHHEPTLPYGQHWWSRSYYCWSMFTGMECRSLDSTHGFKIDREGIHRYVWRRPALYLPATNIGSGGGYGYVPTTPPTTSYGSGGDDFCLTHDCIPNFDNGNGTRVECADGTWSDSGGIQGACSDHGGEM